jgi:hypothetical protein
MKAPRISRLGWAITISVLLIMILAIGVFVYPRTVNRCDFPDCDGGPWAHVPPDYWLKAPFPGSLMPTDKSILPGFVKSSYNTYTKDSYLEMYTSSDSGTLQFEEIGGTNPSKTYQKRVAEEDEFAKNKSVARESFTYLNEPGVIYTWDHKDGTATYILIWKDSKKLLEITFRNAHTDMYANKILIDILKTMKRASS